MLVNSLPLHCEQAGGIWPRLKGAEKKLAENEVAEVAFYPFSFRFLFALSSTRERVHRPTSHKLSQSIFKPIVFNLKYILNSSKLNSMPES